MTSAMQVLRGSRPSATTRRMRSLSEKMPTSLPLWRTGDGADVAVNHDPYGFEDGMAQFGLECILIFDQVADTHLIPPGVQGSELSKSIYRGASICRTEDVRKAKKVGQRRNLAQIGKTG